MVRLIRYLCLICVIIFFLISILFGVIHHMIPKLEGMREDIEKSLSQALNTKVTLSKVEGGFSGYNPAVSFENIQIFDSDNKAVMVVKSASLKIDILLSIITLSPVFESLIIDGSSVKLIIENEYWYLSGFNKKLDSKRKSNGALSKTDYKLPMLYLRHLFSYQKGLQFKNIELMILANGKSSTHLFVDHFEVTGRKKYRELTGILIQDHGSVLDVKLNTNGYFSDWPEIDIQGTVKLEKFILTPWIHSLVNAANGEFGVSFDELQLDMEITGAWHKDHGSSHGSVSIPILKLKTADKKLLPLFDFKMDFFVNADSEKQQVWLQNTKFQLSDIVYPETNYFFQRKIVPDKEYLIAADKLFLSKLTEIVKQFFSGWTKRLVAALNPRGELQEFVFKIQPNSKSSERDSGYKFDVVTKAENIMIDSAFRAPSGRFLSGSIRMNQDLAIFDINASNAEFGIAPLYRDVWKFNNADGRVIWHLGKDTHRVYSHELKLSAIEGEAAVRFDLNAPRRRGNRADDPINLSLQVGVVNNDAPVILEKYIPSRLGSNGSISDWLNKRLHSGRIIDGGFIWNGSLNERDDEVENDISWGFYSNVINSSFEYHSQWPICTNFDGVIIGNTDSVFIEANKAKIYDSHVKKLRVELADFRSKPLHLSVVSDIDGKGEDVIKFLQETPVSGAINGIADEWSLSGDVNVRFSLGLTLDDDYASDIDLVAKTENGKLGVFNSVVVIDNLVGKINYSTKKGLNSNDVYGELFNGPLSLNIKTHDNKEVIELMVKGVAEIKGIESFYNIDLSSFIGGEIPFSGNLVLPNNDYMTFELKSSLLGLTSYLPSPLDKKGKDADSVEIQGKKKVNDKFDVTMKTTRDMNSIFSFSGEQIKSGVMHLGKGNIKQPKAGLIVDGSIPYLDVGEWIGWYKKMMPIYKSKHDADKIKFPNGWFGVSGLDLLKIKMGEFEFENVRMSMLEDPRGVHIRLQEDRMRGVLTFPVNSNISDLKIENLMFPENFFKFNKSEFNQAENIKAIDPLSKINASEIPELDVSIYQILQGKQNFGELKFKMRHNHNGLLIDSIDGELGGVQAKGHIVWRDVGKRDKSYYQGKIKTGDLKPVLKHWGIVSPVSCESADFKTDIHWDGSPLAYDLKNIEGTVALEVKDGHFYGVSTNTGFLKVFGVLNIEAVTRRLRLDFSDLYKSGVPFDVVKSVVYFDKGKIIFLEPLKLTGPSSNFKLGGNIDMIEQRFDLELVVTLPVTDNLPLLGLLLGQPHLAGVLYVFDKILGKKIQRLASAKYEIKGSFTNPEVKLDRFFSDKVK